MAPTDKKPREEMRTQPGERPASGIDVRIRAQLAAQDFVIEAMTQDINREGICLVCSREMAPGSLVQLSLSLILGQNSATEDLKLTGRVLWCTPVSAKTFQLGVIFAGMDAARVGYLDMFLRLLQQKLVLDLH
jgi:Tfp pilus assembly protein PilZ